MSFFLKAFSGFSEKGTDRPLNEDAFHALPEKKFFAIADGYGGKLHENSGTTNSAKKILTDISYFIEKCTGDSEVTLPFIYRRYYTESANLVFNAFLYANEKLVKENEKFSAQKAFGGKHGASVCAAILTGNHMTLANAGNCQVVLVRDGNVQLIAQPKSYQSMMVTAKSALFKSDFPLHSLGHTIDLEPEITEIKLKPADILYLLTDGLYVGLESADYIESAERVLEVAEKNELLTTVIEQENQWLINKAKAVSGSDDSSVITMVYK